jgi:DNA-binding transcriptional LysR family regulator
MTDKIANIELRQLRWFVAVAEHLSFTKAALALHIGQPPLSQSIQRLETDIGTRLFERTTRKVKLTYAGEVLFSAMKPAIQRLDAALAYTQEVARGSAGRLVVGFVGPAILGALPRVLKAFQSANPGITVMLRELSTSEQVRALVEGTIDVGFVRLPGEHPDLHMEPIHREAMVIALPMGHPLAKEDGPLPLSALANEQFVAPSADHEPGLVEFLQGLCSASGFKLRVVQESRLLQTVLSLVAEGFGVAIVGASASREASDLVKYRPIESTAPVEVDLVAAWNEEEAIAAVHQFYQTALQVLAPKK